MSRRILSTLVAIAFLVGCGGEHESHDHAESSAAPKATAPASKATVVWPALTVLDELGHEIEADIDAARFDEARAHAQQFHDAMMALAHDKIPAGAPNAAKVEVLQLDLEGLAAPFADAKTLSNTDLQEAFEAVDAVVHELIPASGVPHVHNLEHGHDHEHSHDH